jgi:hypothetical protein
VEHGTYAPAALGPTASRPSRCNRRSATDGGHQGALVLQGKLRHGGHPILRWCAANVTAEQDSDENLKPSKKKSHERIDGISALVNALTVALPAITGSVYDERPPLLVDL